MQWRELSANQSLAQHPGLLTQSPFLVHWGVLAGCVAKGPQPPMSLSVGCELHPLGRNTEIEMGELEEEGLQLTCHWGDSHAELP